MLVNKLHALPFALSCLICGPILADGAGSSGGGDLLFNHFVRGLGQTRSVLEITKPAWLKGATPPVLEFYKENHAQLLAELDASPMDLRTENPNGKCAETGFTRGSTIYISKTQCGDIAGYTMPMVAEILIGEVTHHFAKDNKFAAMTAIAVMDAFRQRSLYELPSIVFFGQFIGSWDDSGNLEAVKRFEEAGRVWQEDVKRAFGDEVESTSCPDSHLLRDLMEKGFPSRYAEILPGFVMTQPAGTIVNETAYSRLGVSVLGTCEAVGYTNKKMTRKIDKMYSKPIHFNNNPTDYVNAKYLSIQEYNQKCSMWKTAQKEQYGERLIFSDCSIRTFEKGISHYESNGVKGVIHESITATGEARAFILNENP
ncbi:MAG: hypothetical protein NTV34_17070 [Proteobacteria bacterium]|nr:hypothetical protein [Pseudomonadota bacterium]